MGGAALPAEDDAIWELLARTRPDVVDPPVHAAALGQALVEGGAGAAVAFAASFRVAMAAVDTEGLRPVVLLLLGERGDTSHRDALAWIVSRGREAAVRAATDPEGYGVALLDGTARDDELVAERIEDLALFGGEPFLAAVDDAHRRLGLVPEPWAVALPARVDVDDIEAILPRLVAVLPDVWWSDVLGAEPTGPPMLVMGGPQGQVGFEIDVALDTAMRVQQGLDAHAAGDNDTARERLDPVVDDPARWQLVAASGGPPVDVAYIAGVLRLEAGDPDGAARILRLGIGVAPDDRVRRALAQVELSRGELAEAEELLDTAPTAALMDQALVVTLRWRQDRREEAVRLATELVDAEPRRQQQHQHPWTVAGALVQAAFVAGDAGAGDVLDRALARVTGLVRGAPPELPLITQGAILAAARGRLRGDLADAQHLLDLVAPRLEAGTCDLGLAQVEHARIVAASGDATGVATAYGTAAATLDAAGERWLAARIRQEAATVGGG